MGMRRTRALHWARPGQAKKVHGQEESAEWIGPWPLRRCSANGDVARIRNDPWMVLLIAVEYLSDATGELGYFD